MFIIASSTMGTIKFWTNNRSVRFLCTHKKNQLLVKTFYQVLGVTENCDDETLRLAFVNLAKRFHPDSGTKEASSTRFSEIENAYRKIQRHRFEEREKPHANLEIEEFDIEHTAPQHRHYLTHNVSVGTPSARQRIYAAERAQKASEKVMEHRLKKIQTSELNTLVGKDKQRAKDIKTRYGMDRLVEDLIQESMNKGEFRDLPGQGKPLKDNACNQNPYVDFVTHKLNQVLIDNGFIPEWIQLSKEIREETELLKRQLKIARNKLGHLPLSAEEESQWEVSISDLTNDAKKINSKVDKYNLLVPILQKQMLQINLVTLAQEALIAPPDNTSKDKSVSSNLSNNSRDLNFVQLLASIFSKQ